MSADSYRKGGRSQFFAEMIRRTSQEPGKPVRTMSIFAEREVTLSENLATIEERCLRAIVIEFNSGWAEDYWVARLSKGQAVQLRDALDAAIRQTDDDEAGNE